MDVVGHDYIAVEFGLMSLAKELECIKNRLRMLSLRQDAE
jgi:hypothetical protein